MSTKLSEVNEKLKEMSSRNGCNFIDNSLTDGSCLNGSKLHLNSTGSAYFATSFIKFLRPSANKSKRPQGTAVRRVINAASVRTNTCPSAQESTAVDKACHDPMGGEFGSTTRSVANLKGFKIASMNVNSLLKHIDEIRHVSLSAPFDIFAINESKIDELISDNEISIPGYEAVSYYIFGKIYSFPIGKTWCLEMVCAEIIYSNYAEINGSHSKPFLVCTRYRPPNSIMDLFNEFKMFFSAMRRREQRVNICR